MIFDIELMKQLFEQIDYDCNFDYETNVFLTYIKDISGRYLFANKNFLQLHDLSDVVDKTDKDLFDDRLSNHITEKDLLVISKKEPVVFIEEICKNEKNFYYKSIRFPIFDISNDLSFIWYIGVNISKIENSRRELIKNVGLPEDTNKSISMFIEKMGHEIRTPLNAVIAFTYLTLETELTEYQRSLLDKVQNAAKLLFFKFETLFDYSKINSKIIELTNVEVKIDTIVDNVTKEFENRLHSKDIKLNVCVKQNVPKTILSSPIELMKSVSFIILSSMYSMEKGEINLEIDSRKQDKDVVVSFVIRDNAPTLLKEDINQINNPFYFMNESGAAQSEDIGINLTLASGYIKLLNSTLKVEVVENIGNKFLFSIYSPIIANDISDNQNINNTMPSISDVNASSSSNNNIKILLVEDNLINQRITLEILRKYGFTVYTADNGLEAVDMFKQDKFDLVLMDVEMPVKNGYDATREIVDYQSDNTEKVPIIGLTAHKLKSEKRKCIEAGMVDVLSKPVKSRDLINIVTRNISKCDKNFDKTIKKEKKKKNNNITSKIKSIDYADGLERLGGNDELYFELLMNFKSRYEDFAISFHKTIKEGRIEEALADLHGLKGASGNLSAKKIYNNCLNLRKSIDDDNSAKVFVNIQYLHDSIIELTRELEEISANNNSKNNVSIIDVSSVRAILNNLYKSVTKNIDIANIFDYLSELKEHLYNTSYRTQFEELKSAIDRFDLAKASECLTDLINKI